jgi:hypothetical protein
LTRRVVRVERGARTKAIDLDELAQGEVAERAAIEANAWIKSLRHAQVDGHALRDRFTYRGDSLWWFAELFLHKEGVVHELWRTALALDALCAGERPSALGIDAGDRILAHLLPQAAARYDAGPLSSPAALADGAGEAGTSLKGRFYTWGAWASRWIRRSAASTDVHGGTLAFVHAAFWRRATTKASEGEEGYIGAVLDALARREAAAPLRLIGIGPPRNFRARRWWHPLSPSVRAARAALPVVPVEQFASRHALEGSTGIWRQRGEVAASLLASEDIRARARLNGYDVWPLIARELRGIAELQFPWSARAMDEAAAALDACRPRAVVTYAEAGGWGRALVLEARRRGVPSVGLQHGFIYRHWLNYRHEPDEMEGSSVNPADRGFPRPDLTLLYDGYAAAHLESAGHFAREQLRVTGSPALDRLAAGLGQVADHDRRETRRALGVAADARLALLVSKYSQTGRYLPALIEAATRSADTCLVIKPHPAETPAPYEAAARGRAGVIVAPPSVDLVRLLSVAHVVVTVNSTVAVDAMVLGIPGLVLGLPNNLTPLVEAGALAGVAPGQDLGETLIRLLTDASWRSRLLDGARRLAEMYGMRADGHAAERAADVIANLSGSGLRAPGSGLRAPGEAPPPG